MKKSVRCTYLRNCYLAEELECYGFKVDCPLYMRDNDEPCNEARFDAAMDALIHRTRQKHKRLSRTDAGKKSTAGKPVPAKSES